MDRLGRFERYLFGAVVALNLIPVLAHPFFPTMDGPAHLYNSRLILSLLLGNEQLAGFFAFTPGIVPNWTGHILLSILNAVLPANLAEKAFLVTCLAGLPLAFRSLLMAVAPHGRWASYLIFPFTYSFLFMLGFYNFSLALVFLFVALRFWVVNGHRMNEWRILAGMLVLSVIIYFSHVFVFAVMEAAIGIHIAATALHGFAKGGGREILFASVRRAGRFLLATALPLLLFCSYYLSTHSEGGGVFLPARELLGWLMNIRPVIALNVPDEEPYALLLFQVIAAALAVAVYLRADLLRKRKELFTHSDSWLAVAIFMLLLYFLLPDSDSRAGFVSVRVCLLFYLFLILWLGTVKMNRWFTAVLVIGSLYVNFSLNSGYATAIGHLSEVAVDCHDAGRHVTPNSVVLPLNHSDNWLQGHFSNYAGADVPMVILENYEATTGYFPLMWRMGEMPDILLGELRSTELGCAAWTTNPHGKPILADHVLLLGGWGSGADGCRDELRAHISAHYVPVYEGLHCTLYGLR